MNGFPSIIVVILFWLLIGLPLSKLGKKAQQTADKAKQNQAQPAQRRPQQAKPGKAAGTPVPAPAQTISAPAPAPVRPTVMQPTITITEHDDWVYQGSLNAETGEGYDPCHDEQLAPLTLAETAVAAEETAVPGLQLSWTGSDVVRGIVMSEILNRR